jgi:mono/diheme cytochrome c family protein
VRAENQRLAAAYLREHPCVDCGEPDIVVLEFDHLRDKVANISQMVGSGVRWERIAAEIEKCEVVCANCHRRRTARAFGYPRWLASHLNDIQEDR